MLSEGWRAAPGYYQGTREFINQTVKSAKDNSGSCRLNTDCFSWAQSYSFTWTDFLHACFVCKTEHQHTELLGQRIFNHLREKEEVSKCTCPTKLYWVPTHRQGSLCGERPGLPHARHSQLQLGAPGRGKELSGSAPGSPGRGGGTPGGSSSSSSSNSSGSPRPQQEDSRRGCSQQQRYQVPDQGNLSKSWKCYDPIHMFQTSCLVAGTEEEGEKIKRICYLFSLCTKKKHWLVVTPHRLFSHPSVILQNQRPFRPEEMHVELTDLRLYRLSQSPWCRPGRRTALLSGNKKKKYRKSNLSPLQGLVFSTEEPWKERLFVTGSPGKIR